MAGRGSFSFSSLPSVLVSRFHTLDEPDLIVKKGTRLPQSLPPTEGFRASALNKEQPTGKLSTGTPRAASVSKGSTVRDTHRSPLRPMLRFLSAPPACGTARPLRTASAPDDLSAAAQVRDPEPAYRLVSCHGAKYERSRSVREVEGQPPGSGTTVSSASRVAGRANQSRGRHALRPLPRLAVSQRGDRSRAWPALGRTGPIAQRLPRPPGRGSFRAVFRGMPPPHRGSHDRSLDSDGLLGRRQTRPRARGDPLHIGAALHGGGVRSD